MSTTTSVKFCTISEPSLFTKYFELVVYHGLTIDLMILGVSEIILLHSNPIFINSSNSGFFKTGKSILILLIAFGYKLTLFFLFLA